MQTTDYSLLTRVFTRTVIADFAKGRTNGVFQNAVNNFISPSCEMTNLSAIDELYNILRKNYRNEYYYKNTLLNKLLLGVHSTSTTTALTELPVGKAKADFVLINGKAVVYEIKTELDNFERLDDQILNYYRSFDHVAVVTCESNYDAVLEKYASSTVGIYVLTKSSTLRLVKKPDIYKENINHYDLFSILRKSEYENILTALGISLPDVSQFEYYNACFDLFCKLDIEKVYKLFLAQLKARNKHVNEYLEYIPRALKSLGYFCNFSSLQYIQINTFLNKPFMIRR